jgi:hypothetical protein
VRSSRPPSNARRANSPGEAGRHVGMRPSADNTALMTARPPCTCSSMTSSVVKERGAAVRTWRVGGLTVVVGGALGWGRTAEEDGERVIKVFCGVWVHDVAAL